MRVELVHDDGHLVAAGDVDVLGEGVALDALAGGVGRIAEQDGTDATADRLEFEGVGTHCGLVGIAVEIDARSDALEQTQSLLVRGVVGREEADLWCEEAGKRVSMVGGNGSQTLQQEETEQAAYLCIGKNCHDAGEAGTATRHDAHIVGSVLTLPALPVQRVVIIGNLVAQLPDAGVGSILDIIRINRQLEAARRGTVNIARLRRPLAHVGPRRVGRREAVLSGPGGGVDDAGLLDVAEHGKLRVAGANLQFFADRLGLLGGIAMVLDVHVVRGADGLLVMLLGGGQGAARAGSSGRGHAGTMEERIYMLESARERNERIYA